MEIGDKVTVVFTGILQGKVRRQGYKPTNNMLEHYEYLEGHILGDDGEVVFCNMKYVSKTPETSGGQGD